MEITVQFLKEKYDWFNNLIFNNRLPGVPIATGNSTRNLGSFRYLKYSQGRNPADCKIIISRYFNLSPEQAEDVLLHEMIHCLIWYENMQDTSSHGPRFRRIMEHINTHYNRHICIRNKEEIAANDSGRWHYICVTTWENGRRCITLMAKSRIFEIYRALQEQPALRSTEWYVSRDTFFNNYKRTLSLRIARLSDSDYRDHISTGAIRCQCDGKIFKPILDDSNPNH